jgi:hypothetical protein
MRIAFILVASPVAVSLFRRLPFDVTNAMSGHHRPVIDSFSLSAIAGQ